jgi:hypothetical protein
MSLDARLSALEMKLGISSNNGSSSNNNNNASSNTLAEDDDLGGRLDALQAMVDKYTTTDFKNTWYECQKLLMELDPGEGLTYQQQPLMYKRQEVLAMAPQLERDFKHLSTLVGLLHNTTTSQYKTPQQKTHQNPPLVVLTEDTITQAPILTTLHVSMEDQRRLDALRVLIEDLNGKTRTLTTRLHQLLEAYHAIMTAASEKCILLDEVLSMKESPNA